MGNFLSNINLEKRAEEKDKHYVKLGLATNIYRIRLSFFGITTEEALYKRKPFTKNNKYYAATSVFLLLNRKLIFQ